MATRTIQKRLAEKFSRLEKENDRLKRKVDALYQLAAEAANNRQFIRALFDEIPVHIYFKDRHRRFVRVS